MNVLWCYADVRGMGWNSSEWRVEIPAEQISRAPGHAARKRPIADFALGRADEDVEWADVVILQRNAVENVTDQMRRWRALGKKLVVDIDDGYQWIPPSVLSYRFWSLSLFPDDSGNLQPIQPHTMVQLRESLQIAHALFSPSRRILEDWRGTVSGVCFGNYLPAERYGHATCESHDGLWVCWGGGASHLHSWLDSGVLRAIKRLAAEHADVTWWICGGDIRIFEALPVPDDRKRFVDWMTHDEWPVQAAKMDIGLAPLAGPYDMRRSHIKALEWAYLGVPYVHTDAPPYEGAAGGVPVRNDENEWYNAIKLLLQDAGLRRRLACEGKAWAEAMTAERRVGEWIAALQHVARDPDPGTLVSIIVPCYNQADTLAEAVGSALGQTHKNIQVVIVNDGSTDDTEAVAARLAAADNRVIVLTKPNGGLPSARNEGVRASSGEFILPLDADDKLNPNAVAEMLRVFEDHPSTDIVYPDYTRFGAEEGYVRSWDEVYFYDLLRSENGYPYSSMFRRHVWEDVGGYDEESRHGIEDWSFWLGAARLGFRVRHLPVPLLSYRVRQNSQTERSLPHLPTLIERMMTHRVGGLC